MTYSLLVNYLFIIDKNIKLVIIHEIGSKHEALSLVINCHQTVYFISGFVNAPGDSSCQNAQPTPNTAQVGAQVQETRIPPMLRQVQESFC